MNTPQLNTERLILRRFTLEDAKDFYDLINDQTVNTYLPILPFKTLEEAEGFIQRSYIDNYQREIGFKYAICLNSNNRLIGYCIMSNQESHDFGYALKKEFWGNGYVNEACVAIVEEIKKSGISYITATHDKNNLKSGNVMKRLNMKYCYSYVEMWQPKNIEVTFRMYQLNFDGTDRVYKKYWEENSNHFI